MDREVTRQQAEAVLAIIEKRFATYLQGAGPKDRPTLRDHTHGEVKSGSWSIDWESGSPEAWALSPFAEHLDEELYCLAMGSGIYTDVGEARQFAVTPAVPEPEGVECYPINSFTLGISPA